MTPAPREDGPRKGWRRGSDCANARCWHRWNGETHGNGRDIDASVYLFFATRNYTALVYAPIEGESVARLQVPAQFPFADLDAALAWCDAHVGVEVARP